uniref:ZF-HD dimerization-type domain-containing protein n=1 Tax=Ananas comosus var. bracteatus TaxID=296719 RepID=A0A6V7P8E7_ANACO|nr:unnamed protein product [Ananas comosus var. bracteatus]
MDPPGYKTIYLDCIRNHAATFGLVHYDGCCEYVEDRHQPGSSLCEACGCHRSFHRPMLIQTSGRSNNNNAAGGGGGNGGGSRKGGCAADGGRKSAAPGHRDGRKPPTIGGGGGKKGRAAGRRGAAEESDQNFS